MFILCNLVYDGHIKASNALFITDYQVNDYETNRLLREKIRMCFY